VDLRLAATDRERLAEVSVALGAPLDARAIGRVAEFAELLGIWAARTNLISCRNGRELVDRHVLDSLVLAQHLRAAGVIVDLGSGAGFPGVPLAIAFPEKRLILVEPRRRRASFLREVARRVAPNIEVAIRRAELEDGPAIASDAVVSRAVWADESIASVAAPWLRPGGVLVWVRGANAAVKLATDAALQIRDSIPYEIPGSHRGRIEVFERLS
jgi:16S rRNA (guanine527-N7)-methyltransferase